MSSVQWVLIVAVSLSHGQSVVFQSLAQTMSTPKKTRVSLSIAQKLQILDQLKEGKARQKILNDTGIGMRSLERIIKQENELRKAGEGAASLTRKRKRGGKNEEIDEAPGTLLWHEEVVSLKKMSIHSSRGLYTFTRRTRL